MRTLTKDGRRAIVRDVLAHAFVERIDAFLTMEKALVAEIDARVYPADIRQKMLDIKAFNATIDEDRAVFSTRSRLMVNVAGMKVPVGYTKPNRDRDGVEVFVEDIISWCIGKTSHETRSINVLVATNWSHDDSVFLALEAGDELGDRVSAYYAEREAIYSAVNSQRGSIMGILMHIKNEAQLKARWPEILPIAEKHLTKPRIVQLPAVPTQELNSMLKLPPEKADAEHELEAA